MTIEFGMPSRERGCWVIVTRYVNKGQVGGRKKYRDNCRDIPHAGYLTCEKHKSYEGAARRRRTEMTGKTVLS